MSATDMERNVTALLDALGTVERAVERLADVVHETAIDLACHASPNDHDHDHDQHHRQHDDWAATEEVRLCGWWMGVRWGASGWMGGCVVGSGQRGDGEYFGGTIRTPLPPLHSTFPHPTHPSYLTITTTATRR